MAGAPFALPVAVALGGAVGALARHYMASAVLRLQEQVIGGHFPAGIFVVNILGSFLMGLLVGGLAERLGLGLSGRAALQVGFLGAFTTFSTFSLDTVLLWERGDHLQAAGYVIGSVALAVIGLVAGLRLMQAVLAG